MSKKEKKITPLKAPNPILILAEIILFCAVATYIVPAGVFDRVADSSTDRMIVDPNSFHYVEQNPVKLFDIFKSLTLGLQKSSDVIFFLFTSAAPLALGMPPERIRAEWAIGQKDGGKRALSDPGLHADLRHGLLLCSQL